ncbi:MAG: cell division protein ZapA [Candidatus Eisenbacteria bacterium]|uniref:Cell division protein ZapA n=1 Tax=Eiseniibacteriota bacterium TaxID=2212470 RepID=A0A937X8S2_UNCEI|nr:cell division protein ZapA [Candidatus Eisenbacteria bacterium]
MGAASYARVVILGEEYRIAGEAEGASIPELAAYVDDKMNAVRRQSSSPDAKRIAVMASLNLADELFRERARSAALAVELQSRVARLDASLATALSELEAEGAPSAGRAEPRSQRALELSGGA